MNRSSYQKVNLLRLISIIGILVASIRHVVFSENFAPRQEYSYYAFIGIAIAVGISLLIFHDATTKLVKNLDLLVPFGLYIAASETIFQFSSGSFGVNFLNSDYGINWATFTANTIGISIAYVIIGTVFVGWTTRLILQLVRIGKTNLIEAFAGIYTWLPRTLLAILFGLAPILIFLFLLFPLVYLIFPLILLISILTPIWNILTCAVLPFVLATETPIRPEIKNSINWSLQNVGKIIIPVILPLVVSGWLTFFSVTLHLPNDDDGGFGSSYGYNYKTVNNSTFYVNFNWVGSYRDSTDWHKDLLKTAKTEPVPATDFRISLLMIILAIVAKIKIIEAIYGKEKRFLFEESGDYLSLQNKNGFSMIPLFLLVFSLIPFELSGLGFKKTAIGSNNYPEDFESPKTYFGQDSFDKTEIFKWEKEMNQSEGAFVLASAPTAEPSTPDPDEAELEDIHQIYTGEIDDEKGIDVLIAGSRKALILDTQGKIKKEIDYNLGSYTSGDSSQDYHIPFIQIVDLNNDGKPEIAGHGTNVCVILDLDGKIVWKYKETGKGKESDVDKLEIGDINNDGKNEIVVYNNGIIEIFDQNENILETGKFGYNSGSAFRLANFSNQQSGKVRLLYGHFLSNSVLLDENLEKTAEIKKPYSITGFLPQKNDKTLLILFDSNSIGLFDVDGNLLEKYDAPLSQVKYKFTDMRPDNDGSDTKISVFNTKATWVKFRKDQRYLAVLADVTNPSTYESSKILYIYDSENKLVYLETIKSYTCELSSLPKGDGSEELVVTDEGKVTLYSIK